MAPPYPFRLGVADDPLALQPTLAQCLEAVRGKAEDLMGEVLHRLAAAAGAARGPHRMDSLQDPVAQAAVAELVARTPAVAQGFRDELTRLMYEGGGKEHGPAETLRFEDLRLFEDAQLDQSIEAARAEQQVLHAVDDVLPPLDALVSTMLGWRTIQPGLNPLRPEIFARALLASLAAHVPGSAARDALVLPASGLLGVQLRELYRELAAWLRSAGVEAAVPLGGRPRDGQPTATVSEGAERTLLTLDRLRKLLAGDFDEPQRYDFQHTVPASMGLLQDLQQVDVLVRRLEAEKPPAAAPAPAPPLDLLAASAARPPAPQRIGQQLGREVVRLLFDNLAQDARLLPAFQAELQRLEAPVQQLARQDSRFFSERHHPARQLLDRLTQRSLAFGAESDDGWQRFLVLTRAGIEWLESRPVDAEAFAGLLRHLQAEWERDEKGARQRREEAARALLHAEQRNLLAQRLAAEFEHELRSVAVADFVREFLRNSWSQVVAEARLRCEDGDEDPHGYRALVDDLVWSVQRTTAQRGRARRLVQVIPRLLERLAAGLQRIGYPPELTQRFFDNLMVLHRDAVQDGRDPQAEADAEQAWGQSSGQDAGEEAVRVWLDANEVADSGYLDDSPLDYEPPEGPPGEPLPTEELATGAWIELRVQDEWVRAQLTWCSPHRTLFMFTSPRGSAHSMSRRTLERLRASGALKVIADRAVVDEALDHVAQAALKNSL